MGRKGRSKRLRAIDERAASLEVAISLIGTFSMRRRPKVLSLAVVHLRGFADAAPRVGDLDPEVFERIADRLEIGEAIGEPE